MHASNGLAVVYIMEPNQSFYRTFRHKTQNECYNTNIYVDLYDYIYIRIYRASYLGTVYKYFI